MTDMFKGDDAGLHLEFRSADRTHVPNLEPRACNQRPKTNEHRDLRLYRYGDTNVYQWWSCKNGSFFEDPCDEPFVIIGATDDASLVKGEALEDIFDRIRALPDHRPGTDQYKAGCAAIDMLRKSSPPVGWAGGWRPDRESAARLIDPAAFSMASRKDGSKRYEDALDRVDRAYRLADQVLALPPLAPAPSKGEA